MNDIWQQVLTELRRELDDSALEKWFAPSSLDRLERRGGYFHLYVKDSYVKTAITSMYLEELQEALGRACGDSKMELIVIVDQNAGKGLPIPEGTEVLFFDPQSRVSREKSANVQAADYQPPRTEDNNNNNNNAGGFQSGSNGYGDSYSGPPPVFNPRYTFSTFVVGGSNRFAHAAAMAVAESPSRSYNPLFIYGGSGLGKTHLMHAIGQAVLKKDPSRRVIYVSSEVFTNEFIYLLREGRMNAFKNRYRNADILLVDDIQFLINKTETQEEFFHTFNALHDAGKQIVISSDRPTYELKPLEERLRSRFEWGLITDIQPPDWETRCAILQQKAISEDMTMDDQVAYFIAEKVQANIRELEGALNKVIYYTKLFQGSHIDMRMAMEALKGVLPDDEPPKLTISLIQKVVADYFQITVDDLKSRKKDRYITHPRQIAMYLSREMVGATQPQIGRDFGGRDHTTVIHACEKISSTRSKDSQLERSLTEIEKLLRSPA